MRTLSMMTFFFSILLASSSANAQQKQAFDDMLTRQLHQELTATLSVQQDPDIVKAQAKAIRALYQALVEEGFTQDQALTLVAATLSRRD